MQSQSRNTLNALSCVDLKFSAVDFISAINLLLLDLGLI